MILFGFDLFLSYTALSQPAQTVVTRFLQTTQRRRLRPLSFVSYSSSTRWCSRTSDMVVVVIVRLGCAKAVGTVATWGECFFKSDSTREMRKVRWDMTGLVCLHIINEFIMETFRRRRKNFLYQTLVRFFFRWEKQPASDPSYPRHPSLCCSRG